MRKSGLVTLVIALTHCTATTIAGRQLGEATTVSAPTKPVPAAKKPQPVAAVPVEAAAAAAAVPAAAPTGVAAPAAAAGSEGAKKHHKADKGDAAEKTPEEKIARAAAKKSKRRNIPAWFIVTLCAPPPPPVVCLDAGTRPSCDLQRVLPSDLPRVLPNAHCGAIALQLRARARRPCRHRRLVHRLQAAQRGCWWRTRHRVDAGAHGGRLSRRRVGLTARGRPFRLRI